MKKTISAIAAALAGFVTVALATEVPPVRRVVVVVFDGMRPDYVSAETSPNLWRLAQEGVFFGNHHPVYLSSTEVNGVALATGAYPARSTVISNSEFRPAVDPGKGVSSSLVAAVRKVDGLTGGRYLAVATLAEFLHTQGVATVVAGSKGVALLHDRGLRADAPGVSPVVSQGETLPETLAPVLVAALGAFPAVGVDDATGRKNRIARDNWTTRALTEVLWKDRVPAYSLLWLGEPDELQHSYGPGSAPALAGIKNSDANLGRVLAALEQRGLRATTDVLVVSDHGFSTISRVVDVAVELSAAGFDAARAMPGGLQPGRILVVSENGSVLLYIGGHDAEVARRVAAWLPTRDWAGVILSRTAIDGTFSLAEARIDSPEAPDFVVSLRWDGTRSANGTPGQVVADGGDRVVGQGTHHSLSGFNMRNTLIAAGPDFKTGIRDPLPSANLDVVPTVLHVLGFSAEAAKRDGRVLSEALTIAAPPQKSLEFKRLIARRDTPGGTWTQYLQITELNGVRYLDEGNGAVLPKAAPTGFTAP